MGYTLLKATDRGVVLEAYHARRFAATPQELAAWTRLSARIEPGTWAVSSRPDGELDVRRREGSRLEDGMPWRRMPSPVAGLSGAFPKPAPPCAYDGVRGPGVATLLTDPQGSEFFEACVAAVVAWDGHRLVCVPADRPRVWSTADAAIREHLLPREDSIGVADAWPLLLVNAVKGTCALGAPAREPFPAAVRARIENLFESLTIRP